MPVLTACIGAWPKPEYLTTGNWQEQGADHQDGSSRAFTYTNDAADRVPEEILLRATRDCIADQFECGVDIPTDGEQRRENYIHYHCRHLDGIDFDRLTETVHRNGAAVAPLPSIRASVRPRGEHFLDHDFKTAQDMSARPLKMTVPGPLTIMDTTADLYYDNERELAFDLANALNFEIRHLAESGCRYIQVDEPLFARKVDAALDYGVEALERCFDGLPEEVTRVMHMCCGYPGHVDDEDYLKADPSSYFRLSEAIDRSSIHQVSLEDAHCLNDLKLLERFSNTTVILGVVAVARSRVEGVAEIQQRLTAALRHIDADRLLAAPDCGLIMLDRDLAVAKLENLCTAAHGL